MKLKTKILNLLKEEEEDDNLFKPRRMGGREELRKIEIEKAKEALRINNIKINSKKLEANIYLKNFLKKYRKQLSKVYYLFLRFDLLNDFHEKGYNFVVSLYVYANNEEEAKRMATSIAAQKADEFYEEYFDEDDSYKDRISKTINIDKLIDRNSKYWEKNFENFLKFKRSSKRLVQGEITYFIAQIFSDKR